MVQQGSPQAEQAEITWKAREPEIAEARKDGMREVVEWVDKNLLHTNYHSYLSLKRWRVQLKVWGVDDAGE